MISLELRVDTAATQQMLREARAALGLERRVVPQINNTGPLYFPLRLRPASKAFRGGGISNFVDLNASTALKDFMCGRRTYDGHRGIDFTLFPYAWRMMDGGEVEIVAAAPGSIVSVTPEPTVRLPVT